MTSQLRDGLILLLAAGFVSGLVVPLIVNRVQTRNQERLTRFEADVARQAKVIDAQVAFVERLADALWAYQLLLIAPLYYGQWDRHVSDDGPYARSREEYLDEAGQRLAVIRAEIGKAVRLVPADLWTELRVLYYQELLKLDLSVTKLLLSGPTDANRDEWSSLQGRILGELAQKIDDTVDRTADALSLKAIFETDSATAQRGR